MRRFLWLFGFVLVAAASAGCSNLPEPSFISVATAPPEFQGLRIHVRNSTMSSAERDGENVNWLTIWTRASVQRLLSRAGYTVVVDRADPHDLTVTVDIDWQMDQRGVATLTATSSQHVVEQLSAIVEAPEGADFDAPGTDELVTKLASSDAVLHVAENSVRGPIRAEIVATPE